MSESARALTLPAALELAASKTHAELVFHLDEAEVRLTNTELAERAEVKARCLVGMDIRPGDRIGLLGPNRPEWAEWAFATWMAGAVLVPAAHPLRVRDPSGFSEQIGSVVAAAQCRLVVAAPDFLSLSPEGSLQWDELPKTSTVSLPSSAPEDDAVIQFTSGSTSSPKGVVQTHEAILAERRGASEALELSASDIMVGWLPFFYGGGFASFLMTFATAGIETHVLPTERFARAPAEWFRLVDRLGATITPTPPTALAAAIRAALQQPQGVDLSSLRAVPIGAETIEPELVDAILERAASLRLRPEALTSTYGLEEAVCVVSVSPPGHPPRFDTIDLDELVRSGGAIPAGPDGRRIASCGIPIHGVEVKIADTDGAAGERRVGDILIRGPSIMRRYIRDDLPDPFVDGWMRTEDLGYIADGELYVTGRLKDVIFVYGRNYYPEDFEWSAGRVAGVRPGRCVAFGRPQGDDTVVVLVEPGEAADADKLPGQVRNAVSNALGVVPTEVLVLSAGSILKTDSGKLRRSEMRKLYSDGELTPVATS